MNWTIFCSNCDTSYPWKEIRKTYPDSGCWCFVVETWFVPENGKLPRTGHHILSQTQHFSWVEQAKKTLFGYPVISQFIHGMKRNYLTVLNRLPPKWPTHLGRTMGIHGSHMAKRNFPAVTSNSLPWAGMSFFALGNHPHLPCFLLNQFTSLGYINHCLRKVIADGSSTTTNNNNTFDISAPLIWMIQWCRNDSNESVSVWCRARQPGSLPLSQSLVSAGSPGGCKGWVCLGTRTIYKAYVSGLCKGISPENMALYGTVPPF